jgi:hypothetical protein
MRSSPRRPVHDPLIRRQYEPSRLHSHTIISTYSLLIPIASRRPGSPRSRPGEPGKPEAWVEDSRPEVAGA